MHYGYIPIKSLFRKCPFAPILTIQLLEGKIFGLYFHFYRYFWTNWIDANTAQESVKIYKLAGGVGTFWRFTAHLSCRQWRGSAPSTWPPLWPWTCHQFAQSRRLKRLQLELNTLVQDLNMAILLGLTRFLTDDRVIPKPLPTGQTLSEWSVGKVNWFVKSPRELV